MIDDAGFCIACGATGFAEGFEAVFDTRFWMAGWPGFVAGAFTAGAAADGACVFGVTGEAGAVVGAAGATGATGATGAVVSGSATGGSSGAVPRFQSFPIKASFLCGPTKSPACSSGS